jgi:TIR domain
VHDVFISHSTNDKPVADALCAALENAQIGCWIAPRDVLAGRAFSGEVKRAIERCKVLLLVFSSHSNNSEHVLREVQLAAKNHLPIVQFRIEGVVPSDDFDYYLSTPHWLDALTPPLEAHTERLIRAIKTLVGADRQLPPSESSERSVSAMASNQLAGIGPESPISLRPPEAAQPDTPVRHSHAPTDVDSKVATASNDLAPLLAEHRRVVGSQIQPAAEDELPLSLWLNFPRALIAGYGSVVEAKIENNRALALEQVELILESNGLAESIETSSRQVAPGKAAYFCVEVVAAKPGNFVLRCNIKGMQQDQAYAFRGMIPITINTVPDNANLVVNISDIQCVRGTASNIGSGQEFGAVKVASLLPEGAIRTLNDLLNTTFPQSFGRVPLEVDYEVSRADMAISAAPRTTSWFIPTKFLDRRATGTKLKLEPIGSSEAVPAIHLVARNEFKIGRSRQDADFLTWFWPRSAEHDDQTRRLSKVHVTAARWGEKLTLRDAGSANRATFEGYPLSERQNDLIDQRGTLILSHEYQLDVTPFDSTLSGPLRIRNERLWNGPPATDARARRGCVRFIPVNSEIALYVALWLFTDANFGCSKLNPLVLTVPGVAEVEGRFHYYRQNFWIEDLVGGNGITVDEHKLAVGEIVPVVSGSRLKIGDTIFRATSES